jgi:hypothetical protein
MPESFDKIRSAKLRGSSEDKAYLSNAGRKGAEKANETKAFNKMNEEIAHQDRLAEMAELATQRRDDLLDD